MNKQVLLVGLAGAVLLVSAAGCESGGAGPTGSAAVIAGEDGEVHLTLDQVPAKVRATILAHTDEASIVAIELDRESGEDVYDVEVRSGGEFMVSPAGEYLGVEADDDDDEEDDD